MRLLAAWFFLVTLAGCQSAAPPSPTTFALIGDNPYKPESMPRYERMIERINADPSIDWVLHLGDMKDGIADCSDASLKAIHDLNRRFSVPFILTPGDNDWFDCAREPAGGYDRLDRLDKLREIFYGAPPGLAVVSQQQTSSVYRDYIENVYWMNAGVLFANVHLVGVTGTEGGMGLVADLQYAGIEWLHEVFAVARNEDVRGLFIATQADLFPFTGERSWLMDVCPHCPMVNEFYGPFHDALVAEARTFTKPIVLAVGDTHIFRVDKPLYDGGQLVEHFTRVETFGEDQVHWVRVVVRPETPQVFHFYQEIIPENTGPVPAHKRTDSK